MKKNLMALICLAMMFPCYCFGVTFNEHAIDSLLGWEDVYAVDLDGDGDIDILSAHYAPMTFPSNPLSEIVWWENDGGENFTKHIIKDNFNGARSVYAVDLDGDHDVDVLSAAEDDQDITWWENDGSQNFTEHIIKGDFGGATSVYAVDMDGDDDIDVLGTACRDDDITWWENDGSQSFTEHTIKGDLGSKFDGAFDALAVDLDGDTDIDVLGVAYKDDDITWWENDGSQSFTEHPIEDNFDNASSVYAVDLDGDGDIDVLGTARNDQEIAWWENDGGLPPSFTKYIIRGDYADARAVFATDLDNDGDIDVLGTNDTGGEITWWENDGSQTFSEHTLKTSANDAETIFAIDVNGDGNVDILTAESAGGAGLTGLSWWENVPDPSPTSSSVSSTSSATASGGGGGGCFIATAAYGSPLSMQVKLLTQFRDRFLLTNPAGKAFVALYYKYSPPAADFIAKHNNLRMLVRWSLWPLVGLSWVAMTIGPAYSVAGMILLCLGLVGLMGFRRQGKARPTDYHRP